MKIKALRTITGEYGTVRRGAVAELADGVAERLVKRGLATALGNKVKAKKEAAETASGNPSKSQAGGQNGKDKTSS
jgi:hypothetical protein